MDLKLVSSKTPLDRKSDLLLVCGDGHNLKTDYDCFCLQNPHGSYEVGCVGRAVRHVPETVSHWMNVDANEAKWWAEHLATDLDGEIPVRHTIGEYPWMDVNWEPEGLLWDPAEVLWHGSSALFAVYAGLAMGYQKIVLAGCPLDRGGHFYDLGHTVRWRGETYQAWLDFARDPRAGRVESLSGYTRQILR